MSLELLLRERISEARTRIGEHREAIAREEMALKRWEDALELEVSQQGNGEIKSLPKAPQLMTLSEVRTKEEILKTLLRQSEGGLTSAQLMKLAYPAVSRSGMFQMLTRMKKQGIVVQDGRGFIRLVRQDQQQTPP